MKQILDFAFSMLGSARAARAAIVLCAAMTVFTGCQPSAPTKSDTPSSAPEPASAASTLAEPAAVEKLTIGVMPKLVGIPFFTATEKGAKEAGAELGVEVVFDGPPKNDVQLQVQMLETWIAKGFDAIAVAPNDPDAIAPVLEKARKRGIKVIAWDADAKKDARDFFVNQCTAASVARALLDVMAEGAGPEAKYIIVTGSLTASNQNIWMAEMEKYRQEKYPNMKNLSETPKVSEEDPALATQVTADSLKAYPELQGIFAITSVALPGASEALRKSGMADKVLLTGLTTPNSMKEYIADGTVKKFVLWNPVDLGYLAVHAAVASAKDDLKPGAATFKAGRLGERTILDGDQVILGDPIVFTKENIGSFDF